MTEMHVNRNKEHKLDFTFYDSESNISRSISIEVKSLLDSLAKGSRGALRIYLYRIMHLPKNPFQDGNTAAFESVKLLTPEIHSSEEEALAKSKLMQDLDEIYASPNSTSTLNEKRNFVLNFLPDEQLLKLEEALGVDGRGIVAGDTRPLLGKNHDLIIKAYTYLEYLSRIQNN